MFIVEFIFIFLILIIFYTYFGYPVVLYILVKIPFLKNNLPKPKNAKSSGLISCTDSFPKVTLIISAFNETKETIRKKIDNTLALDYPREKLKVILAIALHANNEVDEALMEYYNSFLTEPDPVKVTPFDEEIYIKFLKFDDIKSKRDENILKEYQNELLETKIDSELLSLNAKRILDEYFNQFNSKDELNISVTKDIKRKGKISQIIRTLTFAEGEAIIFSDANSMFNKDAIKNLVRHFADESVGCVAGEKRILKEKLTGENAEGLYWRYESFLKKLDSELWSVIGAAGELFAIRKELCEKLIVKDVIIEDFVLSLNVCRNGYRVVYEPNAYAEEDPSKTINSEFIRKIRIIAGGFQAIFMFKDLFNIFKYRILSFQYISHRVLRWTITPFLFPIVLILNFLLCSNPFYLVLFLFQILFYLFVFLGYYFEKINIKIRIFHILLYFFITNFAAYIGFYRFLTNKQKLTWDKVK